MREFWIINFSNMDIHIEDLGVRIKSMTNMNLLARKSNITIEQINKSLECGSLYKKRDKIFVRKIAPEKKQKIQLLMDNNSPAPIKNKSAYIVEELKYEELNVSDETFAKENAELDSLDRKTILENGL